jgi:hypothetical protein
VINTSTVRQNIRCICTVTTNLRISKINVQFMHKMHQLQEGAKPTWPEALLLDLPGSILPDFHRRGSHFMLTIPDPFLKFWIHASSITVNYRRSKKQSNNKWLKIACKTPPNDKNNSLFSDLKMNFHPIMHSRLQCK